VNKNADGNATTQNTLDERATLASLEQATASRGVYTLQPVVQPVG